MRIKTKQTHIKMTPEELRGYNERIKNSARVHRDRKKFRRAEKYSAIPKSEDDK